MTALVSLCRLCSNPSACQICEVIRNPRPLTARDLSRMKIAAHTVNLPPSAPFHPAAPAVTAPMPPAAPLAPAPAPLPPPPAPLSGPLTVGDWAGLQARVSAGLLTDAQAAEIGTAWVKGAKVASA